VLCTCSAGCTAALYLQSRSVSLAVRGSPSRTCRPRNITSSAKLPPTHKTSSSCSSLSSSTHIAPPSYAWPTARQRHTSCVHMCISTLATSVDLTCQQRRVLAVCFVLAIFTTRARTMRMPTSPPRARRHHLAQELDDAKPRRTLPCMLHHPAARPQGACTYLIESVCHICLSYLSVPRTSRVAVYASAFLLAIRPCCC